jgi:hypothetical protein
MATGSCLCGAVRYIVDGPLCNVMACHCTQCRKTSGHFVAATQADETALTIEGEEAITWYRSSPEARRAFCATCGSQLFWEQFGSGRVSIFSGTLDSAPDIRIDSHIFCADKGAYYEITDDVPQHDGYPQET